jgi:hypothetical protein
MEFSESIENQNDASTEIYTNSAVYIDNNIIYYVQHIIQASNDLQIRKW